MKISVVTDELSDDAETALELAAELGIHEVELRGVGGRRVPRLDPYWRRRLPQLLDRFGMRVVAISPGLFKIPLPEPVTEGFQVLRWQDREEWVRERRQSAVWEDHRTTLLKESLAFAHELGCRRVIVFGVVKSPGAETTPPVVTEVLREAAKAAEQAGVTLLLENEHICWADTGARTAALVRQIGSPALQVNWDPGNAFAAGECPYPDGYAAVRGLVGHVHVKDARRHVSGHIEWATHGEIDWRGQVSALLADGYDGYLVIETHVRPKIAAVRATLRRLQEALR
ncbi:MAG: sugar phosphate isomerase/epimerase family protein [Armatimonadota bacterium]|nr:sugar phosphate isomerase/epimerase family protein [Armatimonadota bacterium]MDR7401922.1 sugar phosphate isomerase/epimerase family protein [Armatimonadota bacterium]MDR7405031.1 sugar phosphate isomerase/epimerase family protein [Armatimonadota bacterium]MDR7471527.1 sugar phosphate isomerase/epimerase family protein [Armatimonadota bacterium]MDR7507805.1 sugar phosphate isomerase/epimerase family protein [Armatimonadota bacterium]